MNFCNLIQLARPAWLLGILAAGLCGAQASPRNVHGPWLQIQSRNFTVFSNGTIPDTRVLLTSLEQFREAYAQLGGHQAVSSGVPTLVFAFRDEESFRPFLPTYEGRPRLVGGYFQRDFDENTIAVNLQRMQGGSLEVIYHEYAHFLMRQNNRFWPLWLVEGMAEVYSTFAAAGNQVCFGGPKPRHLAFLLKSKWLPLEELFEVNRKSPHYNEREYQGILYAQSWAVTHYLVIGDNSVRRSQYQVFARKMREGMAPRRAFVEAFQTTPEQMDVEVKQYLARNAFNPECFQIHGAARQTGPVAERVLPELEIVYQLGNLLLHTHRHEEARTYFEYALEKAPESFRPHEGFGLLAARQKRYAEALNHLEKALARGSFNFRAYFSYALALHETELAGTTRTDSGAKATLIKARQALRRSLQLMPHFAGAHSLMAAFETGADGNLNLALHHLRTAINLEPENQGYALMLAEVQSRLRDFAGARRTLSPLLAQELEPELKSRAEQLLQRMDTAPGGARR